MRLGEELDMSEAVGVIVDSDVNVRAKLIDAIVVHKAKLNNEANTAERESWKMIPNKRKIVPRGALSPARNVSSGNQKSGGARGSRGSDKRHRRG